MSGRIYLRQLDGTLIDMNESPYGTEDVLQRILVDYPSVLAGEQVNASSPRRWLLVDRESSVPSTEGGTGRWAIDHLFLDQDGVPTIVEVKRSTDTRIRREVVGQMLDYAANAVVYWPAEHIRAQFESRCDAEGLDAAQRIHDELGLDDDAAFWQVVSTNLFAGRIRMIFVADVIPAELRRIVEFLNEQMRPAEVLALELRQFVGEGLQVLVPQVVGQTERAAMDRRHAGTSRASSREVMPSTVEDVVSAAWSGDAASTALAIARWAFAEELTVRWRDGRHAGLMFGVGAGRSRMWLFSYKSIEHLTIEMLGTFQATRPPFDTDGARIALIDRLNAVPGIAIGRDQVRAFPSFNRAVLHDASVRSEFLGVFDWVLDALQTGAQPQVD